MSEARKGWPIQRYSQPFLIILPPEKRSDDKLADPGFLESYLDQWSTDYWGRRCILDMFRAVAGSHALPERVSDDYMRRRVLPRVKKAFLRGELLLIELKRWTTPAGEPGSKPPESREPPREDSGKPAPKSDKSKVHWIEIRLINEQQKPVAAETYRLTLPGGETTGGTLNDDGLARHDNIEAGTCKVCFPNLDAREWTGEGDWRIVRQPLTHTAVQGDHVPLLAKKYGFGDYRIIWDDPKNADLKTRRKNPNVLFPGDAVFIPEKREKEVPRPTDQRHTFETTKRGIMLRIVIRNIDDEPVGQKPCTLQVQGGVYKLTTDAEGLIEREIHRDAASGMLNIDDVEDMDIPVKIGHLDPEDTASGQQARLTNLGYYWGPEEGASEQALKSAIEEFQCDHDLKVTGVCDAATQAKLKEVHGC
ncbi:MAG: peptidoglycan-binding protein [Bryobacteraceae bacterium]